MTVDYPGKELPTVQLLAFFAVCCPSGEIKMNIKMNTIIRLSTSVIGVREQQEQ